MLAGYHFGGWMGGVSCYYFIIWDLAFQLAHERVGCLILMGSFQGG